MTLYETYQAFKGEYPRAILFIQNGNVYVTFGDDARTTAEVCGSPHVQQSKNGPLVTVPRVILQRHVARLIDAGHTVAIADAVTKAPKGAEVEKIIQRPKRNSEVIQRPEPQREADGNILWA